MHVIVMAFENGVILIKSKLIVFSKTVILSYSNWLTEWNFKETQPRS